MEYRKFISIAKTSFYVNEEVLGYEGDCNGIDGWFHEVTHVTYDNGT